MVWQVTNALSEAESARHEVPYAFIQHLLQAPAALEALHSSLKPLSQVRLPVLTERQTLLRGEYWVPGTHDTTSADVVSMGSAHPAYEISTCACQV